MNVYLMIQTLNFIFYLFFHGYQLVTFFLLICHFSLQDLIKTQPNYIPQTIDFILTIFLPFLSETSHITCDYFYCLYIFDSGSFELPSSAHVGKQKSGQFCYATAGLMFK